MKSKHYSVHWQEEEYYYPTPKFIGSANLSDPALKDKFTLDKFPGYYVKFAELLDWFKYWEKVLDDSNPPFYKWFVGGKLNASFNCIDRHLEKHKNKTAFHFVPEPEGEPISHITYQELYMRVNEVAAVLQDFCGLKAGDCVTLYLPMTAELPITMLACARLGIVHSVVFSGFSGQACGLRICDSDSTVLITMDAYYRNGKLLDHKQNADEAVRSAKEGGQKIDKVLIWQRYPDKYNSKSEPLKGRDFLMNTLLKKYARSVIEPVALPAEDILFLMYTSGTTGRPKGAQHSIGGYLAYVTWMSKYILDIQPEDVYWCMADIGWITGHSYIVYGPLALAASSVLYEGVPTCPDAGRVYRIAEELSVNIFHTSPTAIRGMRKAGPDEPRKYNHHFKHMTTVGEPIEPSVWRWYYHEVGKEEATIVDTYWQTETGGFLCSTVPALEAMKPGSTGPGVPGIHPIIFDDDKKEITPGVRKAGNICIKNPWPGLMQTIWKDDKRFVAQYFEKYNRDPNSKDWRDWPYMTGDAAVLAEDGYYRILGRVDDVINIAGHRLGTKEIENASLRNENVAEAAVVAAKDDLKGYVPDLYVALKHDVLASETIIKDLSDTVSEVIGKIARPKNIYIVPDMPKTRSGKIMRRVLAAISNGEDVGDVTTLANPEVVDEIKKIVGCHRDGSCRLF